MGIFLEQTAGKGILGVVGESTRLLKSARNQNQSNYLQRIPKNFIEELEFWKK